jgi:hypothetical protein
MHVADPTKVRSAIPFSIADRVLRGLVAVDFVLLVLTFVPVFSGIGQDPGLADRWWGSARVGGWRADVAWMCGSSLLVLVGGLPGGAELGLRRRTVVVCRLWLPCFVLYVGYTVFHMFG